MKCQPAIRSIRRMKDNKAQIKDHNKRQSNIELLRIISMSMIIAMHYMTKGMKIDKLSVDNSLHNIVFWIIYAFCLSSVNAYVLISGYFAPDAKWSISKVIRLWAEVLVYSILVPLVMNGFGAFDIGSSGLSVKQQIFMPVTYEHYWFATAYIMLLILSPVLSTAVTKLDKRIFGAVLILLIIVFSVIKSVDPYLIPWDRYGNDVMWFVVLYLTAGYIRMYGIPFKLVRGPKKADLSDIGTDQKSGNRDMNSGTKDQASMRRIGWLAYIIFSMAAFLLALELSFIVRKTGKLEYAMDMTYCYNHILIFIASIGLFIAFINMKTGHIQWVNRIAAYTFGIYLIHDNIALRDKWMLIPGMDAATGQWWQIFHMIICVLIIFAVGACIDLVRDTVFTFVTKLIRRNHET